MLKGEEMMLGFAGHYNSGDPDKVTALLSSLSFYSWSKLRPDHRPRWCGNPKRGKVKATREDQSTRKTIQSAPPSFRSSFRRLALESYRLQLNIAKYITHSTQFQIARL